MRSVGFDISERYRHLLKYYTQESWKHEQDWMTRRLAQLASIQAKHASEEEEEEEEADT